MNVTCNVSSAHRTDYTLNKLWLPSTCVTYLGLGPTKEHIKPQPYTVPGGEKKKTYFCF